MDTSNLAKWIDELNGTVDKQQKQIAGVGNAAAAATAFDTANANATPFLDFENAEDLSSDIADNAFELVAEAPGMIRYLIVPVTGESTSIVCYGSADETAEGFPLIISEAAVFGTVYIKAGQKLTIDNIDTGSYIAFVPCTNITAVPVPDDNNRSAKTTKSTKKK